MTAFTLNKLTKMLFHSYKGECPKSPWGVPRRNLCQSIDQVMQQNFFNGHVAIGRSPQPLGAENCPTGSCVISMCGQCNPTKSTMLSPMVKEPERSSQPYLSYRGVGGFFWKVELFQNRFSCMKYISMNSSRHSEQEYIYMYSMFTRYCQIRR